MTRPQPGLPDQDGWRSFFRIGGWVAVGLGVLLTATAVIGFFSAFGGMGGPPSFGPPPNFWMGFVGLPLIAVGSWMLKAGYLGAATRYVSGEVTPPLRDALGQLGIGSGQLVCAACGGRNAADATFCDDCGTALRRTCPSCKADNAADAKFCDDCGSALA
ncbi:MAG: zinc ribbon domain-containing protein [Chloroflexota bacterium]|nr:zinc ribbon domain-containing protein [Chloroflexota bacterium]